MCVSCNVWMCSDNCVCVLVICVLVFTFFVLFLLCFLIVSFVCIYSYLLLV